MTASQRHRIVWKESYKLGIRGVDEDHFILVGMISQLEEAVYSGQGRTSAKQLLRNLVSYVKVHFTREERLMKSHQYPDLPAHRALHDGFARTILEFQESYQQGHLDLADEVLHYLKDWLIGHILGPDRLASSHLLERGVK
jgi:hemerythrin